jgi:biopolymer transport protein ExbD
MAEIQENSGGGGKGKAKKQSTRVDLTPMVDLAFLLITFFMLTTTLAKPKAMQIALPQEQKDQNPDELPEISKDFAMTILLAPKNVVLYYFGSPEEAAADPNAIQATTFSKKNGIRKVIIDRKKYADDLPNGKDKKGTSKFMVLIKAVDSSVYGNTVDILDEMHITDVKRYAIVDISEPEKILVSNAMKNVKE